jgi:hypothetical protein
MGISQRGKVTFTKECVHPEEQGYEMCDLKLPCQFTLMKSSQTVSCVRELKLVSVSSISVPIIRASDVAMEADFPVYIPAHGPCSMPSTSH